MILSIEMVKSFFEMFIKEYKYLAIFASMALESASLPIPSEVIMPFAGILAKEGMLNGVAAFIASLLGSSTGVMADYAIGYFIGKDVLYRHLKFFHVTKQGMDSFDEWFNSNGGFAVFIIRLIPVVRGLVSFPAGISRMSIRKFFSYSFAGIFIWNLALMLFGYYLLSEDISNLTNMFIVLGIFALFLYIIYKIFLNKVISSKKKKRGRGNN
ncbi:MAG: DedA family protein [Candidatus Marsarchaeota archaeon]|nr:DedA family protein [Candidatus Marsarchaeota archaeon]MCL5106312.1 DedA family protein [Candidatus Marsarchaeota archaeon]